MIFHVYLKRLNLLKVDYYYFKIKKTCGTFYYFLGDQV